MICRHCKAWSHPAEFSCYNCGESFCPYGDNEGCLWVALIILSALIIGFIYGH